MRRKPELAFTGEYLPAQGRATIEARLVDEPVTCLRSGCYSELAMAHLSRVAWLCLFLLVCLSAVGQTPERIRREEWDQANKLVTKVDPVYPPPAKQAGIQGTVLFDAVVGKDGHR